MFQVQVSFRFEAAHRLTKHPGKCRFLHGHSYRVELLVLGRSTLNESGMVTDFSVLKDRLGSWIKSNWDHNIILNREDPLAKLWRNPGDVNVTQKEVELSQAVFKDRLPYLLQEDPTAEVLANMVFLTAQVLYHPNRDQFTIEKATIHETETCSAIYTRK